MKIDAKEMPLPFHDVVLVEKEEGGRSLHYYTTSGQKEGRVWAQTDPGVTGRLYWIGGNKTIALNQWSVNTAQARAHELLEGTRGRAKTYDMGLVDQVFFESKMAHREKFEEAGDTGTLFHHHAEQVVWKSADTWPKEIDHMIVSFSEWLDNQGITPLATEIAVSSPPHHYGGTLDFLGRNIEGEYILADWKTSNHLSQEFGAQLAALNVALEATYGISAEHLWSVRVDKETAKVEKKEVTDPERAFKTFISAYELEKSMREPLLA